MQNKKDIMHKEKNAELPQYQQILRTYRLEIKGDSIGQHDYFSSFDAFRLYWNIYLFF